MFLARRPPRDQTGAVPSKRVTGIVVAVAAMLVLDGLGVAADERLSDLDAAGRTFADAATFKPLLSRNAFERGVERRWVTADGTTATVRILQFGLIVLACKFVSDMKQAYDSQGWTDPTPVPGVDDTNTETRREQGRVHEAGMYVKDEPVILVGTVQPSPDDPAELTDLITQESELLR